MSLKRHADDEMVVIQQILGMVNQAKGGWRVASYAFAILVAVLGGLQWFAAREVDRTQIQIKINTERLYILERDNEVQRNQIDQLLSRRNGMGVSP